MSETINWDDIWDNLDWDDERRAQFLQERLRQRARQYAAPYDEESGIENRHTVLVFQLGSERYGIEVSVVRGVRPLERLTRVPGTPAFYRGVVNMRGKMITVLDLSAFFGVADETDQARELAIVRASGLELALLADHIEGILDVPKASLEPIEEMRYALGVTRERLVILDVPAIFEDERLMVNGAEE